jgi:hypothetical protein
MRAEQDHRQTLVLARRLGPLLPLVLTREPCAVHISNSLTISSGDTRKAIPMTIAATTPVSS